MSILAHLSSQVGDRTEYSNRKVVVQCLDEPDLLAEIAEGLKSSKAALVGDCVSGQHSLRKLTVICDGWREINWI